MLRVSNVSEWRKCVEAIAALITEGNFEFSSKGVKFKAIDSSQVTFVDFSMPSSAFYEYKMQEARVGLDLLEFSKVVARASPQDSLSMSLDGSEVVVSLDGAVTRKFKLPLLDISENDLPPPEVPFTAEIELPARILKEAFKDASLFSSSIVARVREKKLFLEAQGTGGMTRVTIPAGPEVKINAREEIVAKYSLGFLNSMLKEADNDQKVVLSMKNESALKVHYSIGKAEISYYLAHMLL